MQTLSTLAKFVCRMVYFMIFLTKTVPTTLLGVKVWFVKKSGGLNLLLEPVNDSPLAGRKSLAAYPSSKHTHELGAPDPVPPFLAD